MVADHDRVLGDFHEEMQRRLDAARRNKRKDLLGLVLAFGLIGFGVWPLGVWHALAILAGIYWAHVISEGPAYRLADELDLLEQKLVARFAQAN